MEDFDEFLDSSRKLKETSKNYKKAKKELAEMKQVLRTLKPGWYSMFIVQFYFYPSAKRGVIEKRLYLFILYSNNSIAEGLRRSYNGSGSL